MIKRAVGVILRNIGLIILAALALAVLAGIVTALVPVDYSTQSQLMVSTYDNKEDNLLDEFMVSTELAKTITYIAQTKPVLDLVNEQLGTNYGMSAFEKGIITVKNASGIITISVTEKDPALAQKVADAMADALVGHVGQSVFPGQDIIKVINRAYEPHKPGLMYYLLNAVKGGVGGAALAVVLVLLLDILRAPIMSFAEIKGFLNLNALGKIRYRRKLSGSDKNPLDKNIYDAEDFHFLRVGFRNAIKPGKDQVFAVISPGSREGKTSITAGLAANLASSGRKVLLIDANLKNPTLSLLTGFQQEKGLSDISGDASNYHELIRETAVPGLFVLPAGGKIPYSLSPIDFPNLLADLRQEFDFIFLDTPAALKHADGADASYWADKAVIVAEYDRTSVHKIAQICRLANLSEDRVAGVIINKARFSKV